MAARIGRAALRHVGRRNFPTAPAGVDLAHPTAAVWATNTGIGKTLVAAALAAAVQSEVRVLDAFANDCCAVRRGGHGHCVEAGCAWPLG